MCKTVTKGVNFFATNLIVARWVGPTKGRNVYSPWNPPKPYPAYTSVVLEYIYISIYTDRFFIDLLCLKFKEENEI